MITKKLKNIFLILLVPIYLHGVEEVLTGFPVTDSFMKYGGQSFGTTPANFYLVSHVFWWLLLPTLYLIVNNRKSAIYWFSIFSLFFIFEVHHIYKAILLKGYYPGLLTSIAYPIIGFFYVPEIFKNWKNYNENH